jgi:hypothetical protein
MGGPDKPGHDSMWEDENPSPLWRGWAEALASARVGVQPIRKHERSTISTPPVRFADTLPIKGREAAPDVVYRLTLSRA